MCSSTTVVSWPSQSRPVLRCSFIWKDIQRSFENQSNESGLRIIQGGTEMIQKLKYITGKDGNGNVYGAIPSDTEIIAKINEVIDVLNQLIEKKEQK